MRVEEKLKRGRDEGRVETRKNENEVRESERERNMLVKLTVSIQNEQIVVIFYKMMQTEIL